MIEVFKTRCLMLLVVYVNVICVRNALSLEMLESIKKQLTQDVDSPDLRVIILRANGPVFSSGHNLKELVSLIK